MRMTVVTKVETAECPISPMLWQEGGEPPVKCHGHGGPMRPLETPKRYVIHGEEFVRPDGTRICLGMTREVAKKLGAPFDFIRQQAERIEKDALIIASLKQHIRNQSKKIDVREARIAQLQLATVWQRIVAVFKGVR